MQIIQIMQMLQICNSVRFKLFFRTFYINPNSANFAYYANNANVANL